jgi:hypothetical protein
MFRPSACSFAAAFLPTIVQAAYTGPVDCTQIELVALAITPVDRRTDVSIADSVTGTFTVNGQHGPLGPRQFDAAAKAVTVGGGTRPGTYQIHLEHPRFLAWDSAGVVVQAGRGCQYLVPVTFTARLTRR